MIYDWQAALAFLATLIAASMLTKFLVFKLPVVRGGRGSGP